MTDQFQALYDGLPKVACKGLCWNSCGPIDMSDAERKRIVDLGVEIPTFTRDAHLRWSAGEKLYCPALKWGAGPNGSVGCTVYEARPMICRVWGVGEDDLSCPHGCETTGTLTHAEVFDLIMRTYKIGGHGGDMDAAERIILDLMSDPKHEALIKRYMNGDESVIPQLLVLIEERRP